jgi:hypothetical protein
MWPTIRAEDSESRGQHPGQTDSLNATAKLWSSPIAGDSKARGQSPEAKAKGFQDTLGDQAKLWQTPIAPAGGGSGRGGNRIGEPMLDGQARQRPTPMQEDSESAGSAKLNMRTLAKESRSFLPAPATSNRGGESSQPGRTSRRRLNPAFVEWLMGWPPNWTVAGPTGFGPAEMESWLSRQRMRLWSLLEGRA